MFIHFLNAFYSYTFVEYVEFSIFWFKTSNFKRRLSKTLTFEKSQKSLIGLLLHIGSFKSAGAARWPRGSRSHESNSSLKIRSLSTRRSPSVPYVLLPLRARLSTWCSFSPEKTAFISGTRTLPQTTSCVSLSRRQALQLTKSEEQDALMTRKETIPA